MINILSTEKNGYESLSNFNTPPFKFKLFGKELFFKNVEIGYQTIKALRFFDHELANAIYKSKNGYEAKKLIKQLELSKAEIEMWNKEKIKVIKELMKECFLQNSSHLNLLLNTKDEVLTHKHPTLNLGDWERLFPELLMELRQELQ